MAAMLAEIKSRMLLPRPQEDDEDAEDPRAELIRRLQEYERFKQAAEEIHQLPQVGRDVFQTEISIPDKHVDMPLPDLDMRELLLALNDVLRRADMFSKHQITREPLSLRARMSRVLESVTTENFTGFSDLFDIDEGRDGVVIAFMAILELLKQGLIVMVQTEEYGVIHVKAAGVSS